MTTRERYCYKHNVIITSSNNEYFNHRPLDSVANLGLGQKGNPAHSDGTRGSVALGFFVRLSTPSRRLGVRLLTVEHFSCNTQRRGYAAEGE